jgi:hypothetical protein
MTIRSQLNNYEVVLGTKEKHVQENENQLIDGNLDIRVQGNVNITGATINLN